MENARMLNPEVNIVTIRSDLAEEKPKTLMQYFLQASPELLFGLQLIIFRGTLRFTRIIHLLSPQNPHTGPGITNLPRPRAKQNTM